ncbi:phage tail assembly protein [Oscillatoria sp. CS-180]|uniref:phage tail assembly protein n=1 Tax=Oscillatoria sp. CS-180 TaxID=3021720 RepID=UPI00232F4937|nr:phage tail assembly protein [Oscillatoria sp. CS-180]MDB9526529.1 phage tail assembly protein [Oscillatoria sp. CS-180]
MNNTAFFPTEFDFILPKGLIDDRGHLHRQGRMRLATAKDEIRLLQDARLQANPAYGSLVLLSQVILRLGELEPVTPEQLENLFRPDIQYLKVFYEQIHQSGQPHLAVQCPQCQHQFAAELSPVGEH